MGERAKGARDDSGGVSGEKATGEQNKEGGEKLKNILRIRGKNKQPTSKHINPEVEQLRRGGGGGCRKRSWSEEREERRGDK